jgi:hypothetical protein
MRSSRLGRIENETVTQRDAGSIFPVRIYGYMVDHIVDMSEPRGRVEIQVGVGRRRRWSEGIRS